MDSHTKVEFLILWKTKELSYVLKVLMGQVKLHLQNTCSKYLRKHNTKARFVPVKGFGVIDKSTSQMIKNKKHYDAYAHFLLSSANNRILMKTVINPAIENKEIVILDRYFYSSLAYSSAANVSKNWMQSQIKILRNPDLIVFVDISINNALNRKDKIESIEKGFNYNSFKVYQSQVLDAYNFYLQQLTNNYIKVNNNQSLENAKKELISKISEYL